MLRPLEASHDNIVGFSLSGDVTDDEYQQLTSELRDAIARHHRIRVLFRMSDISLGSFFNALDERFRFAQEHRDDVERIAIVSDEAGSQLLSRLSDVAGPVETRHFPREDEQQAWAWLE